MLKGNGSAGRSAAPGKLLAMCDSDESREPPEMEKRSKMRSRCQQPMRLSERVKRSAFLRAAILSVLIPLVPCLAREERILLRNETIVTGTAPQRDVISAKTKAAAESKGDGLY